MLQDIYKILEIPEGSQKDLNKALSEIVMNNLVADVVGDLSEDQKNDLKEKLNQAEDKEVILRNWFEGHKEANGLQQIAEESVQISIVKFVDEILDGVDENKKQKVLDYLKGV